MGYDDLAELARSLPHIPKFELRCHPNVMEALRALKAGPEVTSVLGGLTGAIHNITITERDDVNPGSWWLYKDERPVAWGDITDGLMFTLKEEDPRAAI